MMDNFTQTFTQSHLEQARHNSVYDLQSLDQLRQRGIKQDDESALRAAAQQFEAIFMNMLFKGMRAANKVFEDEENPFSSKDVEFFQDMLDNQMASEMSSQGSLGLADLMVKQLSPGGTTNHTPADFLPAQRVTRSAHNAHAQNGRTNSVQDGEEQVPFANATAVSAKTRSNNLVLADQPEWKPATPIEFLERLAPYAQRAAESSGIAPESMLAQAALETGWGRHVVRDGNGSSNNLFNIKADSRWQGDSAQTMTTEYYQGKPKRENAWFRAYNSVAESFDDYVRFLQGNPRYSDALKHGNNPQKFVEALQQAGYATDPAYARKLQTIMQSDVMQRVREQFGF